MKNLIFLFFIFFLGCQEEPKNLIEPTPSNSFYIDEEPLGYLNYTRLMCGLDAFSYNKVLENAAANHAKYSTQNNHHGHDENPTISFFTGKTPSQRAFYAGYNTQVGENISYQKTMISSIDSLFSAIYHRFGFLSFHFNEVGFAKEQKDSLTACVFVMGNSLLNRECLSEKEAKSGKYYTKMCKDEKILISQKSFENAVGFTSHDFITYPYDKAEDVMHYFSGETPDPMPTCKITANPLSVQFRPTKKKIEFVSFRVFEGEKEIKNTNLITSKNDIHNKFTKFDFALFPLDVYKFNTTYQAQFTYKEDGKLKKIQWSFKTRSPKNPYFVVSGGEHLKIMPNTPYDIYFKPKDCNDLVEKYSSTYPSYASLKIKQQGVNLLRVNFKGAKGDTASIDILGKEPIKLFLSSHSGEYEGDFLKHLAIGALLLILAIMLGVFRRKK